MYTGSSMRLTADFSSELCRDERNWDDIKQMRGARFLMVSGGEVKDFNKGWERGGGMEEIEV